MDDRSLIERLKKKDQKALEEIIEEFNGYVAVIVFTILHGCAADIDIQGVINQIFFLLWKNAEKIDSDKYESLKPYLGAIARNTAINEKRKILQTLPLEETFFVYETDSFHQIELKEILSAALKKLKLEEQILLLKFYFQGKTIRQIAAEEGQPESTIKTKLRRGKEKLRKILGEEGITDEN